MADFGADAALQDEVVELLLLRLEGRSKRLVVSWDCGKTITGLAPVTWIPDPLGVMQY